MLRDYFALYVQILTLDRLLPRQRLLLYTFPVERISFHHPSFLTTTPSSLAMPMTYLHSKPPPASLVLASSMETLTIPVT